MAPLLATSMYSAPGTDAASLRLSSGDSTQKAVASAPASTAPGATTVAPMIASAVRPVRGSTMCE